MKKRIPEKKAGPENDRQVVEADKGEEDLVGILSTPPRRLNLKQMGEVVPKAVVEKYRSR